MSTENALPDLPRDLAHALDAELLDVLTLLRAEGDALAGPDDDEGAMHSKESRAVALRAMAADKVSGVIKRMQPYV